MIPKALKKARNLLAPLKEPRELLRAQEFIGMVESENDECLELAVATTLVAATFKGFCSKEHEGSVEEDINVILLPVLYDPNPDMMIIWAPPPMRRARKMSHCLLKADLTRDYFENIRLASENDWGHSVNELMPFWVRFYQVHLHYTDPGVVCNADTEAEALDSAADWHHQQGNVGLFLSEEEFAEANTEENEDSYVTAGNYCHPIPSEHISIINLGENPPG